MTDFFQFEVFKSTNELIIDPATYDKVCRMFASVRYETCQFHGVFIYNEIHKLFECYDRFIARFRTASSCISDVRFQVPMKNRTVERWIIAEKLKPFKDIKWKWAKSLAHSLSLYIIKFFKGLFYIFIHNKLGSCEFTCSLQLFSGLQWFTENA